MAGPKIADRCRESTTTTGTGTVNLGGAATGFRTLVSGIGSGNTCFYCIAAGSEWEVGVGTVTSGSPDTLSRTTILASSNAGAAVNFSAGTKDVFVTDPAAAALINGLTALTAPVDADELGIYDTTAGGLKKITLANLLTRLKPISTASPSGAASASFTLAAGFEAFVIVFDLAPATDAVDLWARTSTDGGSTYDSGAGSYEWGNLTVTTAATAATGSTSDTKIKVNNQPLGNAANKRIGGVLVVIRPAQAQFCRIVYLLSHARNDAAIDHVYGGGARITAADVDAIQFLMSSGNMSGKLALYGLAG